MRLASCSAYVAILMKWQWLGVLFIFAVSRWQSYGGRSSLLCDSMMVTSGHGIHHDVFSSLPALAPVAMATSLHAPFRLYSGVDRFLRRWRTSCGFERELLCRDGAFFDCWMPVRRRARPCGLPLAARSTAGDIIPMRLLLSIC